MSDQTAVLSPAELQAEANQFRVEFERVRDAVGKVIVGQQRVVELTLTALFCGGNVLLEGVPGLGKTELVKALSNVLHLDFRRIQFTPDLMPADVIGTNMMTTDENGNYRFEFRKGPIFTQLLLADEINRATPKTQSALLETMQEGTVTTGGTTYRLEPPFFVLATQNPIEQEGTYPLPEAQVDRFMLKLKVGYPSRDEELEIIRRMSDGAPPEPTAQVSPKDILRARKVVDEVYIDEKIERYIIDIVFATREPEAYGANDLKPLIAFGASPRASINLKRAAKAHAFLRRRGYVTPEDVKAIGLDVLRHRVIVTFEAEAEEVTSEDVVRKVLNQVEVP